MTASEGHRMGRPRPAVRLTRRGRVVLILLALGALLFAFWLGSWRAGVAGTAQATASGGHDSVVLHPGETLWEVAERRAPGADPRIMVHRIIELNGLSGGQVWAGQRLRVPAAG